MMTIISEPNLSLDTPPRKMTIDTMQSDYDYYLANKLTHLLLDNGLITQAEYERICALNKIDFHPFLEGIM